MGSGDHRATVASLAGRAARTRAALLAAVEAIVASDGEAAVTTTRAAAMAGVSVGAVYRYFPDREALLLAAYDATVERIVARCGAALAALPAGTGAVDAARGLLSAYLDAAEAIPAHAGLLRSMRALRPVEADMGANEGHISGSLLDPFLRRFAGGQASGETLTFLNALLGTLVDLYLVTADPGARTRLRAEVEAHMLLALERAATN